MVRHPHQRDYRAFTSVAVLLRTCSDQSFPPSSSFPRKREPSCGLGTRFCGGDEDDGDDAVHGGNNEPTTTIPMVSGAIQQLVNVE
jgi:hypothetical protein